MRKISAVLVAASLVFTAGCLSPFGDPSEPATQPSSVSPENWTPEQYAAITRERVEGAQGMDDDTLVTLAEQICASFDADLSFEQVALEGVSAGLEPETVGGIIGMSVVWECPEHEDKVL